MKSRYILVGIFLLYCFLRLFLPTSLPIVNDESMYMRIGNDFLKYWADPRIPLSLQGKQALTFVWLGMWQRLPGDPLVAVRLGSALFSILLFFIVSRISRTVLRHKHTGFPLLVLATSPLLLFYQRLAIPDAIIAFFYTAAFWAGTTLWQAPRFSTALLVGVVTATGWWFKSNALLVIPSLAVSSTLMSWKTGNKNILIYSFVSILVAGILTYGLISIPFLNRVAPLSDTGHVFTIPELVSLPWFSWLNNIYKLFQTILLAGSPFVVVFPLVFAVRKLSAHSVPADNLSEDRNDLVRTHLLPVWVVVPFAAEVFLAKIFNTRYMVVPVPLLCVLIGTFLERKFILTRLLRSGIVAVNTALSLLLIFRPMVFLHSLARIPAVRDDLGQYLNSWSSGWGVSQAAERIRKDAGGKPAIVVVRSDSGNPEDGMYVYLADDPTIIVVPLLLLPKLMQTPGFPAGFVYFVSRGSQFAGLEHALEKIEWFPKPEDPEFVGVYRVRINGKGSGL